MTLLQTLLITPIETPRMALEALNRQRGLVQPHRPRSARGDKLVQVIQWLLIAASLVAVGYWIVRVPVRSWLHDRQTWSRARSAVALPLSAPEGGSSRAWVTPLPRFMPIPYRANTLSSPARRDLSQMGPVEDFLAPRQPLPEPFAADLPPQPTHLLIPAINLDAPVVETFVDDDWRWVTAQYAVGYLHGTGLPGDPTNMVMAGHAGFFGGVFANLGALREGGDIFVDAAGWRYHYRVRETRVVWPSQVEVLDSTPTAVLTLITCTTGICSDWWLSLIWSSRSRCER